ncbi:MAG TPA: hypothetical protein VMF89_18980, partial [Polyangiales bacterium]|nr:hypothetical protein [Polyangiales bacterium]
MQILWLAVAFALAAVGCAQRAADSSRAPSRSENDAAAAADPGTVVAEPNDPALYIFDSARVHTFEIDVADADLARVDQNPKTEEYVPARLRFEGKSYDVGYRYKGSVGGFRPPCTEEFDGGPKAGKCSIKLSFNWPTPEGQFFGLKKLLFHAMIKDESQLRERLGYS